MASARGITGLLSQRAMHSAPGTSTGAAAKSRLVSLKKIDARVFCRGTEGGNPVTIYASSELPQGSLRQKLATTCDWESVMVATETAAAPTMAFFMPSGEEVSFCAHAAIGGAVAMGGISGSYDFQAAMTGDIFKVDTLDVLRDDDGSGSSRRCRLNMTEVRFDEAPLSRTGKEALMEWSDRLDWSMTSSEKALPARNASVARPKTLVELESVDAVQTAGTPPSDGSFATACATMDESTGVYLYASKPDLPNTVQDGKHVRKLLSYECRQFPRSSGYPEDPATGIAAAALAASLRFGGSSTSSRDTDLSDTTIAYDIYQGTFMGRPSLIQVSDLRKDDSGTISFGLQGRVEIDEVSTIEVGE